VNPAQHKDPFHYEGYTGAFSSFFLSGNPNALKLTTSTVAGVPALRSGEEFVIAGQGFENANISQLTQRCTFWKDMAAKIPL
jgi:hypothetical protein